MAAVKKPLPDVFVEGARKGFNIACNSILPNVLMAFVIIQVLNVTGLLKVLGTVFTPVMAIFGLPGQAIMVLVAATMSMGGATGAAASLIAGGTLSGKDVTILLPSIYLMGSLVQYMGRLLGTAGVSSKHYPLMFVIALINAALAMLVMRFFA